MLDGVELGGVTDVGTVVVGKVDAGERSSLDRGVVVGGAIDDADVSGEAVDDSGVCFPTRRSRLTKTTSKSTTLTRLCKYGANLGTDLSNNVKSEQIPNPSLILSGSVKTRPKNHQSTSG